LKLQVGRSDSPEGTRLCQVHIWGENGTSSHVCSGHLASDPFYYSLRSRVALGPVRTPGAHIPVEVYHGNAHANTEGAHDGVGIPADPACARQISHALKVCTLSSTVRALTSNLKGPSLTGQSNERHCGKAAQGINTEGGTQLFQAWARSGQHNPLHIELAVLALVDTGLGAPIAGDLEPLVGAHGQHKAQQPGDTSHPPKAKEHLQWVVRLNFLRDANSTHTKEICNAQI
jgi:hypothetical protein